MTGMARRIDARVGVAIVRYFPDFPDEVEVYVTGWRVGSYKTASGVRNAIARANDPEAIRQWAKACVDRMSTSDLNAVIVGTKRFGATQVEQVAVWNAAIDRENGVDDLQEATVRVALIPET